MLRRRKKRAKDVRWWCVVDCGLNHLRRNERLSKPHEPQHPRSLAAGGSASSNLPSQQNKRQSNDVAVLIKHFHRLTKRNKRQSNDAAPITHFQRLTKRNKRQSNDVAVPIKHFHRLTKRNKRQSNVAARITHFYCLTQGIKRVSNGKFV
jgi:hypothetical protein